MESSLKPEGVFILFGIFSMIAFGVEWMVVAETQGLSEREKKSLYIPGAEYGRTLYDGEDAHDPGSPLMSLFSNANSNRSVTSRASIQTDHSNENDTLPTNILIRESEGGREYQPLPDLASSFKQSYATRVSSFN